MRGISRNIDPLGRITLPKEYRKTFGIKEDDYIAIYFEGEVIKLHVAEIGYRGIARQLDELGRLTLPKEARRTLEYEDKQLVEMFIAGDDICIIKAGNSCTICGKIHAEHQVHGKPICEACLIEAAGVLDLRRRTEAMRNKEKSLEGRASNQAM